jgi:hypothetical protein
MSTVPTEELSTVINCKVHGSGRSLFYINTYLEDRRKYNREPFQPKAKAVPLHAMQALGGEEVQLLLILDLGTRWE